MVSTINIRIKGKLKNQSASLWDNKQTSIECQKKSFADIMKLLIVALSYKSDLATKSTIVLCCPCDCIENVVAKYATDFTKILN